MTRATPLWPLVGLQGAISAASLVVEIVAGRMLAPHVGMSLYTWTAVIAVVLAGKPSPTALAWTGGAMLAAALTTAGAVLIFPMVAGPVLSVVTSPVWANTALTTAVFFLPSFVAGVPAPVLAQIAVDTAERSGPALGATFASGAVGAVAGMLLGLCLYRGAGLDRPDAEAGLSGGRGLDAGGPTPARRAAWCCRMITRLSTA